MSESVTFAEAKKVLSLLGKQIRVFEWGGSEQPTEYVAGESTVKRITVCDDCIVLRVVLK